MISKIFNDMREMSKEFSLYRFRTRDLELELRKAPRDPQKGVTRNIPQYDVGLEDWLFQNDRQVRRRFTNGAYESPLLHGPGHDGFSDVMHARFPVDHGASDFQLRQTRCTVFFSYCK